MYDSIVLTLILGVGIGNLVLAFRRKSISLELPSEAKEVRATVREEVPVMPVAPRLSPTVPVDILRESGGVWAWHGDRPEGHPDLEIALRTPGYAVRRGGVIEYGIQVE